MDDVIKTARCGQSGGYLCIKDDVLNLFARVNLQILQGISDDRGMTVLQAPN